MKKLLNISDLRQKDFEEIIEYAEQLSKKNEGLLNNKNIGLIFEKNSTRTRLSFQVGINQLSGNYVDVRIEELNLIDLSHMKIHLKVCHAIFDI